MMNWKLIFQLSFFGLIMAFGTVSLIPEKTEWIFWLVIFVFCAVVIARSAGGKYFLHGFALSIFNSIWITASHVIFFSSYFSHHPDMAPANMGLPVYFASHPRLAMVLLALPFGIVFGVFQGLFAFIASKLVKPETRRR
jgi:hypothetical protein